MYFPILKIVVRNEKEFYELAVIIHLQEWEAFPSTERCNFKPKLIVIHIVKQKT